MDDGCLIAGNTTSGSGGGSDALLVKLGQNLDVQWACTYGGPGEEKPSGLCSLADGSAAVVGSATSAEIWRAKASS